VVEAALNHLSGTKGGVAGIYNRASYLPERTKAMQLWADRLIADRGRPRWSRCAAEPLHLFNYFRRTPLGLDSAEDRHP
jgi:hypothetical protein